VIEHPLTRDSRTARSLAPAIERLLAEVGWKAGQLDLLAVTTGPGSFTGLRIGVTTAKTLAYAAGARLVGVDTLEALAQAAASRVDAGEVIAPIIDAHRGQLFTARYRKQADGTLLAETGVEIIDIDSWLAAPAPEAWLTGPALRKLAAEVRQRWPAGQLCEESLWTPSAAAVVRIARLKAAANEFDDIFSLLPKYYRPSYAEEKARR
jgi:tRNA threonylcarbamoyladenosine biosynthesis protein TsaB